jgi:hypothetical protein
MKITEKEINLITGEETITEREETPAEEKERLADLAAEAAFQAESENKATAKAALLDKLGISEDEAKLLLG